jgi:hypothetical protein
MDERRQVHRRQPIVVVLDSGLELVAKPLPLMARNDLGDEIVKQSANVINEFVQVWVDEESGLPKLAAKYHDKLTDFFAVLCLAYPDHKDVQELTTCTYEEILELIYAALEVNGLTHLKALVDPNLITPTNNGGNDISAGITTLLGQKTESSQDSSSQESTEPLSSN